MFQYKIYGLKMDSDIPFRQLIEDTSDNAPDITLRKNEPSDDLLTLSKDSFFDMDPKFCWFHNTTLYCWIEDGNRIFYSPKDNANEEYLRTYILGYALTMLFYQRNMPSIHCSGLRKNDHAILISGKSGSGKSTMASLFLDNGYDLMADDVMVTKVHDNTVYGYPAFPWTKLQRSIVEKRFPDLSKLIYIDEDKDKFLVPWEGEFSTDSAVIDSMFIIIVAPPDTETRITEVTGPDKVMVLLDNMFPRREILLNKNNPIAISMAAKLASALHLYAVFRPEGKDTTETIYHLINEHIK